MTRCIPLLAATRPPGFRGWGGFSASPHYPRPLFLARRIELRPKLRRRAGNYESAASVRTPHYSDVRSAPSAPRADQALGRPTDQPTPRHSRTTKTPTQTFRGADEGVVVGSGVGAVEAGGVPTALGAVADREAETRARWAGRGLSTRADSDTAVSTRDLAAVGHGEGGESPGLATADGAPTAAAGGVGLCAGGRPGRRL